MKLRSCIEFVPNRWLAAAFGLALGLFVARVAFEIWPGQAAALVYWPAAPSLAVGVAAVAVALYRWRGRQIGLNALWPCALLLLYVFQSSVNVLQALVLFAGAAALSVMYVAEALGAQEWQMRWGARLALGAAAAALYLPTLGRAVGKADTFEFQVIAPFLGVAHPTGYPLYILLGKLFSLLPFGSMAWRVNLTSAACALVAVLALYSAMGSVLRGMAPPGAAERENWLDSSSTRRYYCGVVAALALAASPVFWSQAIVAEVYTLNAVFVALLLWMMWRGMERRQCDAGWNARRWLYGLALTFGLSLTNHLTMVLLAPALVLAVWWVRPRVAWSGWLKAAGLFALGVSVYAYILVRWPALHGGQGMPFSDFIGWITGRQFGGALQPWLWRDLTRWRIVGRLLLEAFGPFGAALAAAGAAGLAWRQRRVAILSALAFAAYCAYALIYNVPDISVFLIPAHLIMAAWIGAALFQISSIQYPLSNPRYQVRRLSLIFVLLPLSLIWTNLPRVDQSHVGQDLMQWGRYVLSLPLPRRAAILADSEKIAPLYYLKSVEGVRSDIDMLVLGTEELYRAELDRRVAGGQPVYLARFLPGLAGVYALHSLGPLVRVSTTPQVALPLAPITQRLDVSFGNGAMHLVGYDLTPGQGDAPHRLTLYWQAAAAPRPSYHVRLQLVSEAGVTWWEDPGTHPVGGYNPTAAWRTGEIVADYHEIPIDNVAPQGRYALQVGLFAPFGDEGLPLDNSALDPAPSWYDVSQLDLSQTRLEAMPIHLRANFGAVLLRGASQPGVVPPGGRGQVTLEWEKLAPASDYAMQVTVARADGTPVKVMRLRPFAGEYPVSRWPVGQALHMQLRFLAPDQPGQYVLRVGWVDDLDRWVAARCGWMGSAAYECPVATVRVEGAPRESGINFADQAILVAAQIGSESIRAGGTLEVDLRWQGLSAWPADYTVFVHLIGPDGKLYGQVDAYPVHGTLPTTQWKEGQLVDDPYVVELAPEAPPGDYQVEVGWYLLATLRRLSVLDSAGHPVDDHVIVGKVKVAE